MTLYEVYVRTLDCEGRHTGQSRLGLFLDRKNAEDFIESWQRLWDHHSNPEDPAHGYSPCYMDTERELRLLEVTTND